MNNIKNNNVRSFYTKLINDEYWDLMLFKGEAGNTDYSGLTTECLSAYIDMDDKECISENGKLYSKSGYTWEDSVNYGVTMEHAGITGVDNGFFSYDKKKITNTEFLDIFLSRTSAGTYTIEEGDNRFFLSPITGNTGLYCYDASVVESGDSGNYLALKGGFYQGFFKLYGYDYQVLPNVIENDWHFEFTLRRRSDYETSGCTINTKYPENAGMFFYIGTRAENKFAELYNGIYDLDEQSIEDLTDYIEFDYLAEDPYLESNDGYLAVEDEYGVPIDQYMESISAVTKQYESALTETTLDYFEVETDNKHLLFDHTPEGYTTKTWEEGKYDYIVEGKIHRYHTNPFLIFHHAISGYTSKDVINGTYQEDFKSELSYSMSADSTSNSFGAKINDDGSISYTYITCDEHSGRTVMYETTKTGLIPDNEWCTINIRFKALNGYVDKCGNQHPKTRKMRVYIYVNGFLIFISKDLPIFNFTELNDTPEKQEGVPYNISIGGGSQGLMERIWFDFFDLPTEVYDIERNFAGTFIGDIKSFKMYSCNLDIESIRSNYRFEKSNITV